MYRRKAWIVVIALALVIVAVLLILQGNKKNVMFVCDTFVSDDVLLDTFDTYQKKYQPFEVRSKPTYISFEVDFPVKSCRVTRASCVDEHNMEEELHSYIDSRIGTQIEDSTIKLDTSWWYDSGEWTQKYKLWSYLMLIEDMDGQEHYYYCRVNFYE
jgi:hypothetical protein